MSSVGHMKRRPRPDPVRKSLLNWLARTQHLPLSRVTLRFCRDKNGCFHKTMKRMSTKPKYYVLCTSQGNCTMQSNLAETVDLAYHDVPDEEGEL